MTGAGNVPGTDFPAGRRLPPEEDAEVLSEGTAVFSVGFSLDPLGEQ